jgi:Xaa-Pro aminopeptidase
MSGSRFSDRLTRVRAEMERLGIGGLLVGPSADLRYLVGYDALPLERLTLLVLPVAGEPVLVVPELERPRAEDSGAGNVAEIRSFSENDDPFVGVRAALPAGGERLAVGDRMWATFVLALQESFPSAAFARASSVTAPLRMRKDTSEMDALRRAGAGADRVASSLAGEKAAGRTELEVSRWISDALIAQGHERVNFAIVASGPNAASPHHRPNDRVLKAGDSLVCDFGGTVDGYCSDITRTFTVADPTKEFLQAYAVLAKAQDAAVNAVRPGATAESVDAAARDVITDAGFGNRFMHRTGHGIGLEEHEEPYIISGNAMSLEPGMAFSVEPGIYVRGRFGMRIEDIVVVTDDGVERLNNAPRNPVMLT